MTVQTLPSLPWTFGQPLGKTEMAHLRREMALEGFKWDPRIGDCETLCDRPLYLKRSTWTELSDLAVRLDREALTAEAEISQRPDLIRVLSLPRRISQQLTRQRTLARGPRVSRYDFHWTADGWKVSEVNSDVPGGYIEASEFAARFAAHLGTKASAPGDPTSALVDAIERHACGSGPVALIHATAYSDDAQVMHYLASALDARGMHTQLCSPDTVFSHSKNPSAAAATSQVPSYIVRFYPAEWLPMLGRRSRWKQFFEDNSIPQTNPANALMTQSKRWALLWDSLDTAVPTWRSLCPAHRPVEPIFRRLCANSVYKPTLGRVGSGIVMPDDNLHTRIRDDSEHRKARRYLNRDRIRSAVGARSRWVSQNRFVCTGSQDNQETTSGGICLGVFVIDGVACGVYGRLAVGEWVDMYAKDIAVLLEPKSNETTGRVPSESPAAEIA